MDLTDRLKAWDSIREATLAGDGDQAAEAQHAKGKKTARERIAMLMDTGSFVEMDAYRTAEGDDGVPGEGVITGYGTVEGKPAYAFSQDFTVMGGSVGKIHAEKIVKTVERAVKHGVPVIGLFDSAGARLQEGLGAIDAYGSVFAALSRASGVVPLVALVMGPCIGAAAAAAAAMDFVIVTDRARLLSAGPQVLGVEDLVCAGGAAHFRPETEEEALGIARRLIGYLPENNLEDVPLALQQDDINRTTPELVAVPENGDYDMRGVLAPVVDADSWFEIQAHYAPEMVIGFARFGGRAVGVVANQYAASAGRLTAAGMKKAARMIRLCDAYSLPIVTMVDTVGVLADPEAECAGMVQAVANLAACYAQATVPMVTLVVGRAIGGGAMLMGSRSLGADAVLAWKSALVQAMDAEAAATFMFKSRVEAAADPIKERETIAQRYRETFMNPVHAARCGFIDDAIDAATTRQRIIAALEMAQGKREARPAKKHANLPLA